MELFTGWTVSTVSRVDPSVVNLKVLQPDGGVHVKDRSGAVLVPAQLEETSFVAPTVVVSRRL